MLVVAGKGILRLHRADFGVEEPMVGEGTDLGDLGRNKDGEIEA